MHSVGTFPLCTLGLKSTHIWSGTDFERSSLRFAFPRECRVPAAIRDQRTGVLIATSFQYRQTSMRFDSINESSSSVPNTPLVKIDARSSLGRRCTGDCIRTACSRRDSSMSRSLNSVAILESKLVNASRRWGIKTFDGVVFWVVPETPERRSGVRGVGRGVPLGRPLAAGTWIDG